MQDIARERAWANHGMHKSIDSIANLEYSDIDGDDSHDNSASSIVLNNVTVHNPQTLLDMLDPVRGIESRFWSGMKKLKEIYVHLQTIIIKIVKLMMMDQRKRLLIIIQ